MAGGIKIPGSSDIETIAPGRDPGLRANAEGFGADVGAAEQRQGAATIADANANVALGTGMEHFSDAMGSLAAHLYQNLQKKTSDVWVQTHNINSSVGYTNAIYDNQAAYPKGDADGGTAAQDDMRRRIQKVADDATAQTTAQLGTPTDQAMQRVQATMAGRGQDALIQQTTFSHNQQVIGKQTALDDNSKLLSSRVLSGQMKLDDALKSVEEQATAATPLYSASKLADAKEKWQQSTIDAAIKNRYDAGDKAGGDAIADKYYGAVPHPGDSKAAGVATVANDLGIAPRDLAAVISYETGGRFDPNLMGGKGGNYQGLIQFGPEERAKYGVKPGQSFQDQLPAVENFLRDRGIKPGMNLAQIYSVVNAGSLDANGQPRWSASDGNGNIASHVQNIQRDHYGNADKFLAGAARAGAQIAGADGSVGIPGGDNSGGDEPVLPDVEKANYWRAQSHAVDIDLDRQDKIKARQDAAISKQTEDEYLKDIFSDAPKTTVQGLMGDNRLSVPAKIQLRAVAERQFKDDPIAKVSQQTTMGLITQMRLPDGDPNRMTTTAPIYKAYTDGNLTRADFDFAKKEFVENSGADGSKVNVQRKEFIKNAGDAIGLANIGSAMTGGAGTFQKYNFEQYVARREQEYRAENKNPANLFDPTHPDYLGKLDKATGRPLILKPFLVDAQSAAREEASSIPAATPNTPPPADLAANVARLDAWVKSHGGLPAPVVAPQTAVSQ